MMEEQSKLLEMSNRKGQSELLELYRLDRGTFQ